LQISPGKTKVSRAEPLRTETENILPGLTQPLNFKPDFPVNTDQKSIIFLSFLAHWRLNHDCPQFKTPRIYAHLGISSSHTSPFLCSCLLYRLKYKVEVFILPKLSLRGKKRITFKSF
jgi:hypothetical protein